MPEMEELLALLAIILMSVIGWVLAAELLGKWIEKETRLFFAPALGMAACAAVAYVGAHSRLPWLIPVFTILVLAALLRRLLTKQVRESERGQGSRLFNLTLLTLLCLYGMQISFFQLFKSVYPGPHEVWDIFNATGVSPPDQMFSWHQAMFANLHRHYPQDPFYGEMDLYDRPHLGGYLTLFFFKLFHLPLTEDQYVYPAASLRFYHCFWWLSNNLYLLGIAPLFLRLFSYRGAVLAVASTALSGFVFLSNIGGWTKFAAIYPLLLAVLLFVKGKSPLLQATLCVVSFYLHGSVLPFLAGFGLFQIFCIYYPILGTTVRLRRVVWFAFAGVVLVGAWFMTVRLVGSKQPLLYYYVYDALLTQAQTEPVAQLAQAFYAKHTWASLSLLPLHNLLRSIWPFEFFRFLTNIFASPASWKLSDFGSMIFLSQRYWTLAASGLVAAPFILVGLSKTLSRRYAGRTILALYLVPTLFALLLYRTPWIISLVVMGCYHALILFLWVSVLERARFLLLSIGLAVISLEGVLCVLFSDMRFLPVSGLRFNQLTAGNALYLAAYLGLVLLILAVTCREMRRSAPAPAMVSNDPREAVSGSWLTVSKKVLTGLLIIAVVVAAYSLYCLRFY
jgi:hypothetical protein